VSVTEETKVVEAAPSEHQKAKQDLTQTRIDNNLSELESAQIAKLEAEIAKLETETQLSREQAAQMQHPWRRYGVQGLGAGIVLAVAFFALIQPVLESVRAITEKEAKLAALDAKIAGSANADLSQQLDHKQKALDDQLEKYDQDLEQFSKDLKSSNVARDDAISLVKNLRQRELELSKAYTAIKIDAAEKQRFQQLAQEASSRASDLEQQVAELEIQSELAVVLADRIQAKVDFSGLRGKKIRFIWRTAQSIEAKAIIKELRGYAAVIVEQPESDDHALGAPNWGTVFYSGIENQAAAQLLIDAIENVSSTQLSKVLSNDLLIWLGNTKNR